jgi:hypothetical protein
MLTLKSIDDPRDVLSRMRRWELVQYARQHKVSEVSPEMPGPLIASILRSKGLTGRDAPIPPRPLGQQNQPHARRLYNRDGSPKVHKAPTNQVPASSEINADADLMRQWQEQQRREQQPRSETPINALRAECKRLGIKLDRRDNMQTMKAKIEASKATRPTDTLGRS